MFRLKTNNEPAEKTVSIVGSSYVTTHSVTSKAGWCAGTRREPILMTANVPKTGHETKTSRCGKKLYAPHCSRKSWVPPMHCGGYWRKFRKWLLRIPPC